MSMNLEPQCGITGCRQIIIYIHKKITGLLNKCIALNEVANKKSPVMAFHLPLLFQITYD